MNILQEAVATGLVALVGLGLPLRGAGQEPTKPAITVTLERARQMALTGNPAYLAEARAGDIAAGDLRQARAYRFNPQIELDAPTTFGGGFGRYEAKISQEIEWAGQWGLRTDVAELGVEAAGHEVSDARRNVLADVSLAFYEALSARERLQVAEELQELNARLLEAVRTQAREGEISLLQANLAEIEAGRARARVFTARREASAAGITLGRLLGLSPDTAVVPVGGGEDDLPEPEQLDVSALLARALERRPDLAAAHSRVRQADVRGRLISREAIPNLRVGALIGRETSAEPARVGLNLELPLPLWNRNQGLADAQRAATRRAELERSAVDLRVRAEIEVAYEAYVTASEEARVYAADVLEPARRNQTLLETAYREGKIDLASLVLLRNQLLDAELGYWGAWLARRRAFTELQAATGALSAAPAAER